MKSRALAQALKEVLEKTPEKEWREVFQRFLMLLKKRGALRQVSSILKEFEVVWQERNGKRARVVVAKSLQGSPKEYLQNALRKQGFQYEEEVVPEVVGGVAVFLGNEYLINNTVKSQLAKLKKLIHG